MSETPPPIPLTVTTLSYAQSDETRWWRRFALCVAAFGIVVGVAELSGIRSIAGPLLLGCVLLAQRSNPALAACVR